MNGDWGFLKLKFLFTNETKKLQRQRLKLFLPPGSEFEGCSLSAELTDKLSDLRPLRLAGSIEYAKF